MTSGGTATTRHSVRESHVWCPGLCRRHPKIHAQNAIYGISTWLQGLERYTRHFLPVKILSNFFSQFQMLLPSISHSYIDISPVSWNKASNKITMINMMYIIPASDTISVKSTLETSEHAFWGAFGKVRGIKRDFHAQNDALWRCRRLSFKFKTRSTGLSTDSLSRRQIGHRSTLKVEDGGSGSAK